MPKAYIISDVKTSNLEQMLKYREWSGKAIAEHGATPLVRGGAIEVLEGSWHPDRIVVLGFDSVEKAKAFYHSETYAHAKALRKDAGVLNMIVVEGLA